MALRIASQAILGLALALATAGVIAGYRAGEDAALRHAYGAEMGLAERVIGILLLAISAGALGWVASRLSSRRKARPGQATGWRLAAGTVAGAFLLFVGSRDIWPVVGVAEGTLTMDGETARARCFSRPYGSTFWRMYSQFGGANVAFGGVVRRIDIETTAMRPPAVGDVLSITVSEIAVAGAFNWTGGLRGSSNVEGRITALGEDPLLASGASDRLTWLCGAWDNVRVPVWRLTGTSTEIHFDPYLTSGG